MKKKQKSTEYTVVATLMARKYTSKGNTLIDAFKALKIPVYTNGRTVLQVTNGEYTKERILSPVQTNRLFHTHGMVQDVALKNIALLFEA